MTGYIILGAFIFWTVSFFAAFIFGYIKGRAKEQSEQKDEALRRAESDKAFEVEKTEIMREVFGNANQKKSDIAGGAGRDHFNRINNSLRDNNKN
jgi:predicted membrane protein